MGLPAGIVDWSPRMKAVNCAIRAVAARQCLEDVKLAASKGMSNFRLKKSAGHQPPAARTSRPSVRIRRGGGWSKQAVPGVALAVP